MRYLMSCSHCQSRVENVANPIFSKRTLKLRVNTGGSSVLRDVPRVEANVGLAQGWRPRSRRSHHCILLLGLALFAPSGCGINQLPSILGISLCDMTPRRKSTALGSGKFRVWGLVNRGQEWDPGIVVL